MRAQALLALSSLYLAPSALARATPRDACPAVAPAAAAAADSLKADIRADTNRDGDVDLTGSSDSEGKTQWTADSGAIFLPNIGDTDKRCSNALLKGPAVPNDRLDKCNDASDNTLRSEQYLAPLRTVPMSALPDDATGRVIVKDTKQRDNVRIFYQAAVNGTWAYVDDKTTFNAATLRKGLVLGIDGRDIRRPGGWDGRVTVTFDVKSSKGSSSDNVMLRVAPILTHTHLDTVEQVIGVKANETAAPWLVRFNDELSKAVNTTGIEEPVYQFSGSDDIWAQDFMEPGFASMPGPDGPVTLRIMIRSPQDERVAGRQLFEYYRDTGIGAVQQLGGARDEINSGGNIETIPPYEFNGTSWPAGRIILGDHGEKKHHLTPFFEAQETQQPLHLDTDWLSIGHVDEFLQFVPADSERGWVLMADDPMEAVKMLQKLKDSGYGSQVAYSRKNDTQQSNNTCQDLGCNAIPVPGTTINEMLANKDLMDLQKRCAERIENNLRILKEATGLADDEIIRLPAMFKDSQIGSFIGNGPPNGAPNGPANGNSTDDSAFNGPPPSDNSTDDSVPNGAPFNGPPPIGAPSGNGTAPLKVGALFPGVVNGVVLTGYDTYIAPNPWGPVINGTDILAQRIKEQYAKVNMTIVYIDDWNTHHNFGGEIHCGTNTAREMDIEWY